MTAFMVEFARYLVAAGVTNPRFSNIARLAYFRAASESAKFLNSRTNQSAVAVMTGLTRVQVREFSKADSLASNAKVDRLENILRGWNSDADFTTSNGAPRRLSVGSKNATFALLVRRYGGDVPVRPILHELARNQLVKVKGEYVHLDHRGRQTRDQLQLQQVTQLLARLLRNSNMTLGGRRSLHSMIREVTYPSASSKGRTLVRRKSADGLAAFLSELRTAGIAASIETPITDKKKARITRLRVAIVTEDLSIDGNSRTFREGKEFNR